MTAPQFASPGTPGAGINWADANQALLLVDVHSVETNINTSFGPSDAVRADVTVLDGPNAGDTYRDTLVFPKILQSQLRGSVGQKVLGRLGQGAAKPGQSPPWILSEATPADINVGKQYLAGQLQSVPAGKPPF